MGSRNFNTSSSREDRGGFSDYESEAYGVSPSFSDFDEGDVGSTSTFGGQGGGSAGDFDEDFNYASFADKQMDELDQATSEFEKISNLLDKGQFTVINRDREIRGFDPRGGRYGTGDAAFFAGAIGSEDLANQLRDLIPEPPKGFGQTLQRKAEIMIDGIASRYGHSSLRNYTIDPTNKYIGEITEDYELTDLIGNVIGLVAPGGAVVDRYSSRELTKTGLGQRQFGEAKAFSGAIDTQYAMTPEEEEQMFAEARDRVGFEDKPEQMLTRRAQPRPQSQVRRSGLLASLIGDLSNPLYNVVSPYAADAVSAVNPFSAFTFAEGGIVPNLDDSSPQENITTPTGFVGGPPETMTEAETVADDVPMEVEDGTFVLNAAAVEYMGSADVKKMILNALQELKTQGVDKAQNLDKIELDTQVSLLVSKGEVIIPPQVAQIIGYDRLEKINRRGLKETEKRVQENGQSPEAEALDQSPQNPSEGMTMSEGGKAPRRVLPLKAFKSYNTGDSRTNYMNFLENIGASVLGKRDDAAKALTYARDYAEANKAEDNIEDTMRHILLGGLYSGDPDQNRFQQVLSDTARGFADYKETSVIEAKGVPKEAQIEAKIDLNNNQYGGALRKLYKDEDEFVDKVEEIMNLFIAGKATPKLKREDGTQINLMLSTVSPTDN
jgi:hypothetical protein